MVTIGMFNRLIVARAVLQTPMSLINYLTDSVILNENIFKTLFFLNRKSQDLTFLEHIHQPLCFTCQVLLTTLKKERKKVYKRLKNIYKYINIFIYTKKKYIYISPKNYLIVDIVGGGSVINRVTRSKLRYFYCYPHLRSG